MIDINTPITKNYLNNLITFSQESDNSNKWYEYPNYVIIYHPKVDTYSFNLINETDGSYYLLKYLKNVQDLENLYLAITDFNIHNKSYSF